MAINDALKHMKYKTVGLVAAGAIIGSAFLSGCSGGTVPSNFDPGATETAIYDIVQKRPQIPGVTYAPKDTSFKVITTEFTLDGIKYTFNTAHAYKSSDVILSYITLFVNDGKEEISFGDMGSESASSPFVGPVDGKIDGAKTSTNRIKEYSRYGGLNEHLRTKYQNIYNSNLEKILNYLTSN
jgi:hypothetical protein